MSSVGKKIGFKSIVFYNNLLITNITTFLKKPSLLTDYLLYLENIVVKMIVNMPLFWLNTDIHFGF